MPEHAAVYDFWPTIFQSFRPEDHKFLVVSTNNGLEVAVQEVTRIEEGLVMIRGRISGTADSGRLFLLPYSQLSSVYVNRPVRLEEVDLFSPSVAPTKKLEIARQVADLERRAREDARLAEAAKNGDVDLADALKKLDTLRDQPSGVDQIPALPEPTKPISVTSRQKSPRLPLLGRTARLTAPEPSEPKESGT
jgi:hypothetical protein